MSVKNSYNTISKKFSQTRNHPWPEFEEFLKYLPKNAKVLDVGCGNGRLLDFLKKQEEYDMSYTGIDFSEGLLSEARKKHPHEKFISMDMRDMDKKLGGKFDAIFAIASFHHLELYEERMQVLESFRAHLRPGGKIFMTNWNLFQKKYLKYIFASMVHCIFNKIDSRLRGNDRDWNDVFIPFNNNGDITQRYYHAFTPFELKELFQKSAFKVVDSFSYNKLKRVKFWWQGRNLCCVLKK
jgi:2-polyprenyl-3-methyl-5-hydroxy-6-metoxy-1,4-benzoquinol methylase